ncbi:MAG: acetyl-CoA sensor PanZ family protein [Oleibacter sp.]|nr:acetyl-CoA sensor PanZ family protein [Thalassolituus sp.]
MPVRLEHIQQPTDADWNDLHKIRTETSPLGLVVAGELEDWLDNQHWIIAGRFNDRIIGALLAERTGAQTVILTGAGVRTITQKRGVMHQMMHFIQQWAEQESLQLLVCLDDVNVSEKLQKALLSRGFVREDSNLTFNPS